MVSIDLQNKIKNKEANGMPVSKQLSIKEIRIMNKYCPVIDEAVE